MAWTGHRVVFDLRREMIDRLLALPTPFYDAQSSGRLISKFTFDAYQLAAATSSAITTAVRSTLTIVGSLGFLFWLNWKLTLISIVAFPLVAATIRYFSRRLRRVARDVQQRTGAITQVLEEIVGGQRVVKVFGGQQYERERAVAVANRLRQSMSKQSSASAASSPLLQFFGACAVGFIVYLMLKQSEAGGFDPGPFTAYVVALLTLLDRLRALSGVNANIQRGLAAAESIFALIDEKPEQDRGQVTLSSVRGELVFDGRLRTLCRRRARCAGRREPSRRAGRERGAGRSVRQWQDDARESDSALLRTHRTATSCSMGTPSTP